MTIVGIIGPISPQEASLVALDSTPDFVFSTFNDLITKNLRNGQAIVYQDDVIESLMQYLPEGESRSDMFTRGWLEVESSYRKAGWNVSYDKPIAWGGEDFRAHYIFTE